MASMRIQQCFFGLFCLLSILSLAGGVEMYTVPKVLGVCGQRVTLPCDVLAKNDTNIEKLYWMSQNDICEYTMENQTGTDFKCEKNTYARAAGRFHNYSLSLYNISLKHAGTYHCKLRSKEGVKNGQTIVRVQKCIGNTSTDVSATDGSCTFKDVFPAPIVHWNQGNENLTHLAETKVTQNAEGLFTAVSTLKLKKDPSVPYQYNCSLFLPLENKNETKIEWVRSLSFSGGQKFIGHWFGMMLATILQMLLA